MTTMAPFTPPAEPAEPSPAPSPAPARRRRDDADRWSAPAPDRDPAVRPGPPVAPPPAVERRRAPRRPLGERDPLPAHRDGVRAVPPGSPPPPPAERRRPPVAAPAEPWQPEPAPVGARSVPPRPAEARPAPAREVPARPVAAPPAAPPYGDWTKPSRSGAPGDTGSQAPVRDEPGSGEQPEQPRSRAAELFPRLQASAEALDRADRPATGDDLATMTATIGSRAKLRAEREAAEAARRKAGRSAGRSAGRGTGRTGGAAADGPEGGRPRRSPRRAATGLAAVAVVALGVLGVYSYASPHTRSTASAATAPSTAPAPAPTTDLADLPPLATGAIAPTVAPTPAAPAAHLPVTVLNETTVTGLAARVAGVLKTGGWPVTPVGAYTAKDVAATTVYFTQGDDAQRASAVALVDQFPQLHGPVPRFFDIPGQPTPGIVVVTTGDWKP
jgi:hypothetical protein